MIAIEFLEKKGLQKPFQEDRKITLSMKELVNILDDYFEFKTGSNPTFIDGLILGSELVTTGIEKKALIKKLKNLIK